MKASKSNAPITSSVGAYFLIMSFFTASSHGFNQLFWIYLGLGILNGAACGYQIYLSSKLEENKTVTYYFFSIDRLVLGLLLVSIYLDLVVMDFAKLEYATLFGGIYLILSHLIKKIMNK